MSNPDDQFTTLSVYNESRPVIRLISLRFQVDFLSFTVSIVFTSRSLFLAAIFSQPFLDLALLQIDIHGRNRTDLLSNKDGLTLSPLGTWMATQP